MKFTLPFLTLFCTCLVAQQQPKTAHLSGTPMEFEIIKSVEVEDEIQLQEIAPAVPMSERNIFQHGSYGRTVYEPGQTEGRSGVNASGAFTYEVPISVPPGVRDVQPNISLQFNSQGGNGLAGWGWNLSGLSTISRIPSTLHHDGVTDGIDFDHLDRFALDGQRLILSSGSYGKANSTYTSENYSHLKVKAYGENKFGAHYGPQYFVVYYPDGSRAYYGNTTNSYNRIEWVITRWIDAQGNQVNYYYQQSGGLLRIYRITYGRRYATSANEVVFYYKNRNRIEKAFIGGVPHTRYKTLARIETKHSGQPYRTYYLTHSPTQSGYDRVVRISESNGKRESMAPITFEYESDQTNSRIYASHMGTNFYPGINKDKTSVLTGNFNWDSNLDFVTYNKLSKNKLNVFTGAFEYGSKIDIAYSIPVPRFDEVFSSSILSRTGAVLDQQAITTVGSTKVNSRHVVRFMSFAMSVHGPIKQYEKDWNAPTYTNRRCPEDIEEDYDDYGPIELDDIELETRTIPKVYVSGDFNGDGLTDVIAVDKRYTQATCNFSYDSYRCRRNPYDYDFGIFRDHYNDICCECDYYTKGGGNTHFIDLKRDKTSHFATASGSLVEAYSTDDKLFAADFDGDGKSELWHIKDKRVDIYALVNNRLTRIAYRSNDKINLDLPILPGDYNGDGKTDLLIPEKDGSKKWYLFYSTGKSLWIYSKYTDVVYKNWHNDNDKYLHEFHYIPQDIDQDGKTDILKHYFKSRSGKRRGSSILEYSNIERLEVFLNVNGENFKEVGEYYKNSGTFYSKKQYLYHVEPVFAGINTQNKKLQYAVLSLNNIKRYDIKTPHRSQTCLEQVTNNGLSTHIDYAPLDANKYDETYFEDNGLQHPYMHINYAPGMGLVKKITETDGKHRQYQEFKYKGAVSHVGGLGFMGFTHMARSNIYGDGVGALWNVSRHDPKLRGATTEQWQSFANSFYASSRYISKTSTSYETKTLNNKVFVNVPTQVEVHNKLVGTHQTQAFLYDSYYNLTKETQVTDNYHKTTTYTYYNNPSSWSQHYYIGRPKSVHTKTTVGGAKDFATETQYTYHNNLLRTEKQRANGSSWLTTTYNRDSYGNILTKAVSGSGFDTRTERFTYYPYGRDLRTHTDILGLKTSYEYDPIGTLKNETNPYGQSTQYAYNSWQKLVKETNYLGRVTTISYQNRSGGGYIKKINYPNTAPDQTTYYNALGWVDEVHTQVLTSDQWSKQYFRYDAAGRKVAQSDPDFNTARRWTYTDFDSYGRISQIREATGRTISTSYDGLSATVNDGVKTISTTKNTLDQIVELNDPGGTIRYSYHANGVLREADYGGYVVRTDIDRWGRKERLDDPTAGVYTYDYNDLGELLEETTPKGRTSYSYNLGRVASKTSEGDLTDTHTRYSYDATTQLLKEIHTEDYQNDHTSKVTYRYDGYKRISSITEDRDDARFSRNLWYDYYGRLYGERLYAYDKTSKNSHSTTSRYGYSHTGEQNRIYDSPWKKHWELQSKNARGQATSLMLGNGIQKKRSYNSYGYLYRIDDRKDSQHIALNTYYNFDTRRGLLRYRGDYQLDIRTQHFVYDEHDRLTTAFGDYQGKTRTRQRSYDTRGRVTEDSRMGINMQYGSGDNLYRIEGAELNPVGLDYYQEHPQRQISYNIDRKPVELHDVGNGRMSLAYDTDGHRYEAWYGGEDPDRDDRDYHKSYSRIAPMEIVRDQEAGTAKFLTYVGGDAYTAPMVHVKDTDNANNNGYHYLHRDYLGSILAVSDEDGEVIERAHFDAWGEVAVFQKDGQEASIADSLTGRGFTGHEHFTEVGLVHMNGRMYDPQQGRFLSPDSHIQDPYNTQNYNRYGYVLNNPLTLTDPSGEFFWVAVAIGAFFGGATAAIQGGNFGDIFLGALIGGIAGGLGAGLSNVVAQSLGVVGSSAGFFGNAALSASGFWTSAAVGAAGGFAAGFVGAASNAWIKGASFSQGIKAGLKAGAIAGASAGLIGGVSGGLRASKNGGNFWTGKRPQVETVSTLNPVGVQDVSGHVKPSGSLEGLRAPIQDPVLGSPVGDAPISSIFGRTRSIGSSPHLGTDYAVPVGTPVHATARGVVERVYNSSSYGNTVILNHGVSPSGGGNVYTLYAHGNSVNVVSGQSVNVGDLIMRSGNTGISTSPHLHYEVIKTIFNPSSEAFFRNLNTRYAPSELGKLLGF